MTLTALASCLGCDWTHGPTTDLKAADKAAEKHTATGHPTRCETTPEQR